MVSWDGSLAEWVKLSTLDPLLGITAGSSTPGRAGKKTVSVSCSVRCHVQ